MPSNAADMRKVGPITSTGWPRLQPGATQARTPRKAALVGGDSLPRSVSPHLSLLRPSRCVMGEHKVTGFGGLVTGKTALENRLVGRFAVVKLSEPPAAGRGVFA